MTFKIKIDGKKELSEKLESLGKPVNRATARTVGKSIIKDMKQLISRGRNPIDGFGGGTFPAYKNPSKYPGKRKSARPVNLELSGDFLDALRARVFKQKSGSAVEIGFSDALSRKKEAGHRDGANSQPKRPILPEPSKGETFVDSILDPVVKIIDKRINKVIRS